MKKRSAIILAILAGLLLLVLVIWWFWSLGNVSAQVSPKLQLAVEKGTVLITKAGGQNEEQAKDGMELKPGDRVRTEQGSMASVMAYGRAESRLDEKTMVTISDSNLSGTTFTMRWKLDAGRVWSRVLRLLDLDSVFEGQSSQVIATVRGTAFAMANDNQKVSLMVEHAGVRESTSDSSPTLRTKPEFIVGGQWINLKSTGEMISRGEAPTSTMSDDIRQLINIEEDAWRSSNLSADQAFVDQAKGDLVMSLGAAHGIPPDSGIYTVALWSENFHLWLAGKKAPALRSSYIGRRLEYVYDLILRGKSGLAFKILSQTDKEVDTVLSGGQSDEYRTNLKNVVSRALLAVTEIDPNDSLFRYKLDLEDMYAHLWDNDPAQTFYARSLSVDARLDEAERFTCQSENQDQIKEAINAVEQGMARQKSDFDNIKSSIKDEHRSILTEKMQVQGLRLDYFNRRLLACPKAGQGSQISGANATSTVQTTTTQPTNPSNQQATTTPTSPTSQPPTTRTPTTTRPTTNPTSLGLVKIELYAQPSPANVGDKVSLYVKGYNAAGSSSDVSKLATFQIVGGLGSIVGTTYLASSAGSVTIVATVSDAGQQFTVRAPLTINQAVTLSRLTISPTGGSISFGQSRSLNVTAFYSSGFSKDVTSSVKWSTSNSLGSMSGNTFVAGRTAGSVDVTAQYTEGGKTLDSLINFQIVSVVGTNLQ